MNPWKGIKDATVEQKGCLQRLLFVNKTRGSEDCLYLNINTPTLQNEKLPVLIWIYGGAFKFGTASNGYYDPGRFIEENVIVVTINYRMGALGFLATNTEHAPGNVGMKDIVIGLRWIKKNIHFFGGDSNNICLYGVSSGAGVVEYLTLSPMASGLYHKAIIHSGSALCEVFYVKRPLENAFKLGKHLGLITKNVSELMTFLQNVDARDITYAQDNMDKDHLYPFYLHFVPITEEYQSDEVFLNESPENILKSGKYEQIPTLFGFNDKEGFLFANHRGNMTTFLNLYSKMYEYIMPPSIMSKVDAKQKIEILQEVKELYFKNKSLGIEAIGEFIDFSGDSVFTYGLHRSVKIRSQTSKYSPYYYEFAYTEKNSVYEIGDLKIIGAGHADDTRYTFKLFGVSQADPKSEAFAKKYVRLFTNFMRHGLVFGLFVKLKILTIFK